MLDILAQTDGSDYSALRDALTDHIRAIDDSPVRLDRTVVARAEIDVKRDPETNIRFDETGLATVRGAGRAFTAGRFETPRIGDLRRRAIEARHAEGDPPARLRFWVLDGASPATDIGALQASAPKGSLFQVASQFNCLESPGPYITNVTQYLQDPTQGPRASISAFPGTLVRHYAATSMSHPARFVQKTGGPQVNLLEDLEAAGLLRVSNGYLLTESIPRPAALARALEERFDELRIGMHDDVEVVLGHDWDGPVPGAPHHTIAQVFSSTIAGGGYSYIDPSDANMLAVVRGLQRSAHFGALLAAAALGKSYVVLTLVGGGVFRNPVPVIWESILWAVDAVRPLLRRDLLVVVNGYNLGRHIPAAELREASAARGGALAVFDQVSVSVEER